MSESVWLFHLLLYFSKTIYTIYCGLDIIWMIYILFLGFLFVCFE